MNRNIKEYPPGLFRGKSQIKIKTPVIDDGTVPDHEIIAWAVYKGVCLRSRVREDTLGTIHRSTCKETKKPYYDFHDAMNPDARASGIYSLVNLDDIEEIRCATLDDFYRLDYPTKYAETDLLAQEK